MDFLELHRVELQMLGYVGLAMLLGAVLGLEREVEGKPAGLRTHMLVAGAAALLVTLGDVVIEHFQLSVQGNVVQSDPVRIVEAVITGISFLGAGTIIRHGERRVEGLTTAASLLFSAGVGVCVALDRWVLAAGATVMVLIILRGLGLIEKRLIG
jgi:putative Mg2+ transporter-C (MgtC) family protein